MVACRLRQRSVPSRLSLQLVVAKRLLVKPRAKPCVALPRISLCKADESSPRPDAAQALEHGFQRGDAEVRIGRNYSVRLPEMNQYNEKTGAFACLAPQGASWPSARTLTNWPGAQATLGTWCGVSCPLAGNGRMTTVLVGCHTPKPSVSSSSAQISVETQMYSLGVDKDGRSTSARCSRPTPPFLGASGAFSASIWQQEEPSARRPWYGTLPPVGIAPLPPPQHCADTTI